jgi:signal transduction histidine kinase
MVSQVGVRTPADRRGSGRHDVSRLLPPATIEGWLWAGVLAALVLATLVLRVLSLSVHSAVAYSLAATGGGLVCALVALVFTERVQYMHERRDLVSAVVFAMLAVANPFLAAEAPAHADMADSWAWLASVVGLACSLVALGAFAYPRRTPRSSSHLPGVLPAGMAMLACGNAVALLSSGPYADRLYTPDVFRLAAYVLMFCGCLIEFRALRRRIAQSASLGERRRIARDMHDGLAQELAFITIYTQQLGRGEDDDATVSHLRAAAERALHESRTALAVLSAADDTPLDALITGTADSFRSRFGVTVDLDLQPNVRVEDEYRKAILRIAHEALTNAVRHGGAQRILVRLRAAEGTTHVTIADDGKGFDVQDAINANRGLGLMSMSERAETLGGKVQISSQIGEGTVVEVELP